MAFIVIIYSILIFCFISIFTRNINFASLNTDCQKQVHVAANFNKWGSLSGMHNFGNMYLKDISILILVIFQKIFNDLKNFYPVVMTVNFSNSLSIIFIFFNASFYWDIYTGLFITFLYSISIWPFIIILYGGYHIVSQMFLLISIFFINLESTFYFYNSLCLVLCGIFLCMMFFSSSSSRKFFPLFILAFLIKYKENFQPFWLSIELDNGIDIQLLILILLSTISLINFIVIFDKVLIKALKITNINRSIISMKYLLKLLLNFNLILLFLVSSYSDISIFYDLLYIFFGFASIIFLLIYKNYLKTIKGYYAYLTTNLWATHHHFHKDYYTDKVGYNINNGFGGIKWDIIFILKTLPIVSIFYFFSLIVFYFNESEYIDNSFSISSLILILFFSLSGIFWGRITNGPQSLPAYFPVLIGLLIQIGNGFYIIVSNSILSNFYYVIFFIILTLGTLINLYILATDIFPSKLGVSKLISYLKKKNINNFFTFNTPHNMGVTDVIINGYPNDFRVSFIEKIKNLKTGYLLIPPISKNNLVFFELVDDDFDKDLFTKSIINEKKYIKSIVKSFKTLGSSKYWLHIMDDLSYRDILFNDISNTDRYLSSLWLIDIKKLREIQSK